MKENTEKENINKNTTTRSRIIILSAITLVVVLAIVYLAIAVYFQYHFFKGTTINGKDCSYMTASDVTDMLNDEIRTYYLSIEQRDGVSEHISAKDINLSIKIDGDISNLLQKQNSYMWLFRGGSELELDTVIDYDKAALTTRLLTLKCLDEESMTDAIPPQISYIDGSYKIGKASPGNRLDVEKTTTLIAQSIENMEESLSLEEEGCYLVSYDDNDEKYTEILNNLNKYSDTKITLTFNDEMNNIIIDRDEIVSWMSVDENLNIVFDMEEIEAYVSEISKGIETMGQTRTFVNSYNTEINLNGGDYGWWVAKTTEANAIIEDIKTGGSITREMNYLQTAASHKEVDFGDTYIEINLLTQHLFCYKDGTLITECDIISGKNATPTPTGIYSMRFMFTNYKFDRSYFDRTVPYWMVFYGDSVENNIGLIGCDFRTDFGGSTYLSSGSHGSIYVPMESAAIIYREIPNNTAVVIYKTR